MLCLLCSVCVFYRQDVSYRAEALSVQNIEMKRWKIWNYMCLNEQKCLKVELKVGRIWNYTSRNVERKSINIMLKGSKWRRVEILIALVEMMKRWNIELKESKFWNWRSRNVGIGRVEMLNGRVEMLELMKSTWLTQAVGRV